MLGTNINQAADELWCCAKYCSGTPIGWPVQYIYTSGSSPHSFRDTFLGVRYLSMSLFKLISLRFLFSEVWCIVDKALRRASYFSLSRANTVKCPSMTTGAHITCHSEGRVWGTYGLPQYQKKSARGIVPWRRLGSFIWVVLFLQSGTAG